MPWEVVRRSVCMYRTSRALTTFSDGIMTCMRIHGPVFCLGTSGNRAISDEDLPGGFGHPSSICLPRQARVLLGSIASEWEHGGCLSRKSNFRGKQAGGSNRVNVRLGGRRINALGRMDECPIEARLFSRTPRVVAAVVRNRTEYLK